MEAEKEVVATEAEAKEEAKEEVVTEVVDRVVEELEVEAWGAEVREVEAMEAEI